MTIRIIVQGRHRADCARILRNAAALGIQGVSGCRIAKLYFLSINPGTESIDRLCAFLLTDPVTESSTWQSLNEVSQAAASGDNAPNDDAPLLTTHIVEVALRPGVTDVTARELMRGMNELGLPQCEVATATRYELAGSLDESDLHLLTQELLCNETIERYSLEPIVPQFGTNMGASAHVELIDLLDMNDDELIDLSQKRLLSLDLTEMQAIQRYFRHEERGATDVELETLAQTWSEHCVHKTFRAHINFRWEKADGTLQEHLEVNGLLNQYIRAATDQINPPWLHSAFIDDAGIIAFDDTYDLAFKVETHNHPSALEPFGGANTGIGGVVRDILGVSARPIACTDVLCFGPQDYPHHTLPDGVLHPQRVADGVVAGIGDYGNKLGLPTVNGAVFYDEGYLGNPLVFCGCAGLLPHGRHPTEPQVDDLVVLIGGRTGRDGIHGATFSSAELTHDTAETTGSAVQIGDPITEKGLIELIEAARDEQLYHAITDCGAGGLSSAVGEMGGTLGVDIELTCVPLKYAGLTPWEIWLSEAQERLVLAVPAQNRERLQELADLWDVEISVLGHFTGDQTLRICYDGNSVAQLTMHFLHDGLPRRQLDAVWQEPVPPAEPPPDSQNLNEILLTLLAHPNVASKEEIVRRYDHEVRGGTIGRPFVGPKMDGPADAAVLKPLGTWNHSKAVTLSVGINPLLGRRDPYAMAVSAIDEAIRNAVVVGANPEQIAILDNFCWGNPTYPDRLGALVRTCQGCYEGALVYGTPYISGKDSLYNEFDGEPIPGTLLISAIGILPDMHSLVTSNFKAAGNYVYFLGETNSELGGSLLYHCLDYAGGVAPKLPHDPLNRYRQLHQAICQRLVKSCHDLSEGGLAVALAEMCLGGRLGADIALPKTTLSAVEYLFSESNGRLLLEVTPDDVERLEALFAGQSLVQLGRVTEQQICRITDLNGELINVSVGEVRHAWKGAD
ncbi:phosphoribosylformylglycinamidine synthase subunit PurL [Chloroflexi bacterium TSY]|nr:phosphoribosylformylglycinamidine synthase subunit PurL [Chloroflexi bacterium TSY]